MSDPAIQFVSLDEIASPEAGPRRVTSLSSRRAPLSAPKRQLAALAEVDLDRGVGHASFEEALREAGWPELRPAELDVVQVNVGKLCNMTCAHCHVDSGPDRVEENMDAETVDAVLRLLDLTNVSTVDVTGGAPELNPHFRRLVDGAVERGRHVIDRCNLTVLLLPRFRDLPEWLGERGVEIVCSLPHYRKLNTDAQRGDGTHAKSIEALRRLNATGYGQGDPRRRLTLMANPSGAYLAGGQASLEREWKRELARNHDVTFDRLIALNNMPISRFLDWLLEKGELDRYLHRLRDAFNPAAVAGLMCRNTLSISWDGRLFDCDFNQMLELDVRCDDGDAMTLESFDPTRLQRRRIVTDRHCFGCTAGSGSSCSGATTP